MYLFLVTGNNRIVRLWLESGGRQMGLTINGRLLSSVPVDITREAWRHLCLSYQSDYGAWAIYMDARLVTCEASQSVSANV